MKTYVSFFYCGVFERGIRMPSLTDTNARCTCSTTTDPPPQQKKCRKLTSKFGLLNAHNQCHIFLAIKQIGEKPVMCIYLYVYLSCTECAVPNPFTWFVWLRSLRSFIVCMLTCLKRCVRSCGSACALRCGWNGMLNDLLMFTMCVREAVRVNIPTATALICAVRICV